MSIHYKYPQFLSNSDASQFDLIHAPGATTPYSGIYRCEGCGNSIAANQGNPLPPQNHHQHTFAQGAIRWRLAVWS